MPRQSGQGYNPACQVRWGLPEHSARHPHTPHGRWLPGGEGGEGRGGEGGEGRGGRGGEGRGGEGRRGEGRGGEG